MIGCFEYNGTVLYPGFQKWGSFGPLLSEFGGPSEILGGQINYHW